MRSGRLVTPIALPLRMPGGYYLAYAPDRPPSSRLLAFEAWVVGAAAGGIGNHLKRPPRHNPPPQRYCHRRPTSLKSAPVREEIPLLAYTLMELLRSTGSASVAP